ncbi:FKBP-type peptidyl-prolyl cis-trans isomerase [Croceicoccus naphthovorans]|uniref:Peptidyl-prolyl cis-trans isomerase n=1 Tax=Croceicoccus naphthovorans TaxID=1348774 RepID=A0A0G3XEP1_9SPHN|nr:FKBP-type peptidyl-prolyl cis-trans isomerase [Croceicoccus naphthovorans]AKM09662.1 peptidylprolyl isomerase [Croceicoccus naphthovorans]MBB3990782.1 FKBP-type peptidyl-prolyl cis-trans isomerase SlyD [Croceicoccus naphthovorans]
MQTAKSGDTVLINYVVKTGDGQVVGNTGQQGPQAVTIGGDQIFPQIQDALTGMEVGGETSVTIEAANAFGPRREEMIVEIPRANLPAEPEPQPGMQLSAQQQDGNTVNMVITKVGPEAITADGNHPLASQDLTFDLKLTEIQAAA